MRARLNIGHLKGLAIDQWDERGPEPMWGSGSGVRCGLVRVWGEEVGEGEGAVEDDVRHGVEVDTEGGEGEAHG